MDRRERFYLHTDVVIAGGGAAGVAAAVTAARQGLKVVLLERYGFCGGGAVAGLSGTVCGMYAASDASDVPQQVVFGFADEFLRLLKDGGGLTPALKYGKTFTHVHDPYIWRCVADKLLVDNGITVIYHATVTGILMDGREKVEGVLAYSKQGPLEIRAKVTIDASGDADLIAMADLPSFVGKNGAVQNPTMIFRLQGVDCERFLAEYGSDTIMPVSVSELIQRANSSGRYKLPRAKIWLFPTTHPNELLCNTTRVVGADGRELNPLFFQDFTDAEIEGRKQVAEYARFFKDSLTGCEHSYIADTAPQVGVRQTRQALGRVVLSNDDVIHARKSADGIVRSPWPIELHAGAKPRVEWILDDFYEVPYGCFVPQRGVGILVAGRCLSAEHEAVASARVTAQCFGYGEAIGLAAAISVQQNIQPDQIEGHALRTELNKLGAQLS